MICFNSLLLKNKLPVKLVVRIMGGFLKNIKILKKFSNSCGPPPLV